MSQSCQARTARLAESYGTPTDSLWDKNPVDYGTFGNFCPIEAGLMRSQDPRK